MISAMKAIVCGALDGASVIRDAPDPPMSEIASRALPATWNERTRSAERTARTRPSRNAWLSFKVTPTIDSRVPADSDVGPPPSA